MTEQIKTFENAEFGKLDVIIVDGKEYFPATQCARILGYKEPQNAIRRHCKKDGCVKCTVGVTTGTKADGSSVIQNIEMKFISEGNLYRLIIKSKLPTAERFECWVFDEVLPTIRKTGGYISNSDMMIDTYFGGLSNKHKASVKGLLTEIEVQQKEIHTLKTENDIYTNDTLKWADRSLINSLVRKYSACACNGDSSIGWREFKKELLYKYGINLKSRVTSYLNKTRKKTKPRTLDMLEDSETVEALKTIASMCRNSNVDISDILQAHKS